MKEIQKQRTIIFIREDEPKYPSVKTAWLTDSQWMRIKFEKFDLENREYRYVDENVILVVVPKEKKGS